MCPNFLHLASAFFLPTHVHDNSLFFDIKIQSRLSRGSAVGAEMGVDVGGDVVWVGVGIVGGASVGAGVGGSVG